MVRCKLCNGKGRIDRPASFPTGEIIECHVCDGRGEREAPAGDRFWSGSVFVNVYDVDQEYGGTEEGGWWYTAGSPLKCRPCRTEPEAERVAERWRRYVEHVVNADRPEISSVLSEGQVRVYVEDRPAAHFPEVRPHYE